MWWNLKKKHWAYLESTSWWAPSSSTILTPGSSNVKIYSHQTKHVRTKSEIFEFDFIFEVVFALKCMYSPIIWLPDSGPFWQKSWKPFLMPGTKFLGTFVPTVLSLNSITVFWRKHKTNVRFQLLFPNYLQLIWNKLINSFFFQNYIVKLYFTFIAKSETAHLTLACK